MRLARYLAATTARYSLGTLALLITIYAAIDFVETANRGANPPGEVLAAYAFKLPAVISHVLPIALALGGLLVVGMLRRAGEWDALLAAGVAPARLLVGLSIVPLAGTLLAWPLVDRLAPEGQARFAGALADRDAVPTRAPSWRRAGSRLVRSAAGDASPRELVVERDATGRAVEWDSRGGDAAPGGGTGWRWSRDVGWRAASGPGHAVRGSAVANAAEDAPENGLVGEAFTGSELAERIAAADLAGRDSAALRAQRGLRGALTWACLLVPLLSLLLVLDTRERRAARLVLIGLAVASGYWLVLAVVWNGALLGVWAPAWIGNGIPALFGLLTLILGLLGRRATLRR